ncbi:hypothetical protein A3A36_02175 [Candidatus Kaiserbacteria bacterium RIFCSPLOWO2_01_FULL_52_12b]|uniref:Uncharacterized protein n=1 Tax=Candidatus Kaiserbacteria bacterium RIFCSPLOWO2_01_FULL_52_12b TaxID=1798509 RepID=A0A1F6EX02_9BACT|nr:MAG: hypothetical protein A3A36_02175 [Candidatus Kaiserbacteria bacterium RIFCSPLOWO2_01_FULL_52_12b]
MNIARFRVANLEMMVAAMLIPAHCKFSVQGENICHQVFLKLLYISTFPFPFYEFTPRLEKIFNRNDMLV